ncbi:DUF6624 domain-containing protein [Pontibacter chitinilyticus]|uniref:DUF6624 domain-containing protein n=1 Tax=Pontibacter chitinilyticus TaxID=2674989 RepID=UPI0032198BB0
MKKIILGLLVTFFAVVACTRSSTYQPQGFRKLSEAELVERARARNLVTEKTVIKDSLGNTIPREQLEKMDPEAFFGDQYVNANNEVAEVVLRRATAQDSVLVKKIEQAYEEGYPMAIVNVDCSQVRDMLERVYESDQASRKNGGVDAAVDKANQQIVASIIEHCGFPSMEEHGHKSVEAAFLVIQHADKRLREKYYPFIKASADRGDIPWSEVALMEDRVLTDRGEKQKYGSQVHKEDGSDAWILYPIQDPANVDKRRAEVSLGPLADYLKQFGIKYKTQE